MKNYLVAIFEKKISSDNNIGIDGYGKVIKRIIEFAVYCLIASAIIFSLCAFLVILGIDVNGQLYVSFAFMFAFLIIAFILDSVAHINYEQKAIGCFHIKLKILSELLYDAYVKDEHTQIGYDENKKRELTVNKTYYGIKKIIKIIICIAIMPFLIIKKIIVFLGYVRKNFKNIIDKISDAIKKIINISEEDIKINPYTEEVKKVDIKIIDEKKVDILIELYNDGIKKLNEIKEKRVKAIFAVLTTLGSAIVLLVENLKDLAISTDLILSLAEAVVLAGFLALAIAYLMDELSKRDKYQMMVDILTQYKVYLQKQNNPSVPDHE